MAFISSRRVNATFRELIAGRSANGTLVNVDADTFRTHDSRFVSPIAAADIRSVRVLTNAGFKRVIRRADSVAQLAFAFVHIFANACFVVHFETDRAFALCVSNIFNRSIVIALTGNNGKRSNLLDLENLSFKRVKDEIFFANLLIKVDV